MKMQVTFEAVSRVTLEHEQGAKASRHVSTQISLHVGSGLDAARYTDDGLVTQDGSKLLVSAYIQGLIAAIHLAHQKGWRDSAEHIRYIINEMTRGFAENASVEEGTMDTKLK